MAAGGLFELIIYIAQQAGIMLAVGAEMVVLCTFLLDLYKKTPEHHTYAQSARFAQKAGLVVVILSGLGAVVLHTAAGQWDVLLAPAFIFKWILICAVLVIYNLERVLEGKDMRLLALIRGAAGGNWYALFLVHSVAPAIGWMSLLIMYVLWMTAFGALWTLFVLMMRRAAQPAPPVVAVIKKPTQAAVPIQKVPPVAVPFAPPAVAKPVVLKSAAAAVPVAPPIPKHIDPKPAPEVPHAPLPVLAYSELESPHHMPAPAPLAHPPATPAPKPPMIVSVAPPSKPPITTPAPPPLKPHDELTAIRIMPRTPEDLSHGDKAAVVQLN